MNARRAGGAVLVAGALIALAPIGATASETAGPGVSSAAPSLFEPLGAPAGPGKDCMRCHAEAYIRKKVVHPPVREGLCDACHVTTSSTAHNFGLRADGAKLCRQCHASRSTQKVTHNPVEEGLCLVCHNPHASDNHVRLRRTIFDTCTQCHPSKRVRDQRSLTRHGALDPAKNPLVCVACHDPHQSDHPKRLKAWPPNKVCFKCHNTELATETGRIINMKAWVEKHDKTEMLHGPVREGMCNECHNPHGTHEWRMLKRAFPAEVYAPFEANKTYELCFGCHDRRLVENQFIDEPAVSNDDPATDLVWTETDVGKRLIRGGVTGFRNGNENIHFRHVNKIDKGRTCRLCHDFHASPNPKHIRDWTPFGNWGFKLNYDKTRTGGSCWPGCHVTRRYDRNTKQENRR